MISSRRTTRPALRITRWRRSNSRAGRWSRSSAIVAARVLGSSETFPIRTGSFSSPPFARRRTSRILAAGSVEEDGFNTYSPPPPSVPPAEDGPDPRRELAGGEWLHHVVISPELQSHHAVHRVGPCRNHH